MERCRLIGVLACVSAALAFASPRTSAAQTGPVHPRPDTVPAQTVTHQLCVTFPLGATYADASPRRYGIWIPGQPSKDAGETYGRTDEPFPALAMLARVRDPSQEPSQQTLWGWAPLDEEGCTESFATTSQSVTLEYYDWAYFDDDTGVVTYDCWSTENCTFERSQEEIVLTQDGTTHHELAALKPTTSTFWATVFATFRRPLVHGIPLYGVLTRGYTAARYNFGGWPTANYRGSVDGRRGSETSKFILAHEWGHIQTILASTAISEEDLDYGYTANGCSDDPSDDDYDPECVPSTQHTYESLEYQSAASTEGFADWYAMSVWNDEAQSQAVYIVPRSLDTFRKIYYEGEYVPVCGQQSCPPGVANELDWAFALWALQARVSDPEMTAEEIGEALVRAYPWPDTSVSFWQHFVAALPDPVTDAWLVIGGLYALNN
ncbi:MAG: hypothetical protein ACPG4T_03850 [Nannocystaceae bacterium]